MSERHGSAVYVLIGKRQHKVAAAVFFVYVYLQHLVLGQRDLVERIRHAAFAVRCRSELPELVLREDIALVDDFPPASVVTFQDERCVAGLVADAGVVLQREHQVRDVAVREDVLAHEGDAVALHPGMEQGLPFLDDFAEEGGVAAF